MFTQEQINELSINKNVSRCSSKSITYSKEFKILAVRQYYEEGFSPNMIFREAGFDLDVIGKDKPKACLSRWRRVYDRKGEGELRKENRGGPGRRKKLEFKDKDEEIRYLKAKIEYMDAENDFFSQTPGSKKGVKLRPCQKFRIINGLGGDISMLCDIAQVSRSGYYRWLGSRNNNKGETDYQLIKKVFEKGKKKLGWRSIQMNLRTDYKIFMNHKKIKRIMREYGLITQIRRKNPYKMIMKKTQEHRTFDNILARDFKQEIPGKVLCTDITYLYYGQGRKAYLSVIKDIASKEIVAWQLSSNLTMKFVLDSVDELKGLKTIDGKTIIHSDQGFHYTNPEYIERVKRLNMTQSMSRKGNCIDNSPIESFFGHMKDDVDYKEARTFEELNDMINMYINYYNNHRYQWDIKKMTPAEYRDHLLAQCR